jgi:hypothetical protein
MIRGIVRVGLQGSLDSKETVRITAAGIPRFHGLWLRLTVRVACVAANTSLSVEAVLNRLHQNGLHVGSQWRQPLPALGENDDMV